MTVVKINTISVPEGAGEHFEARFAAREGAVDQRPGFLSFRLLRPLEEGERYLVVTEWESDEDFTAWRTDPAAHPRKMDAARQAPDNAHLGAQLLEFEVVNLPEVEHGQTPQAGFVSIVALSFLPGMEKVIEQRFAARKAAVDAAPGFSFFELWRPVNGVEDYYVVTGWDAQESYDAWAAARERAPHNTADQPKNRGLDVTLHGYAVVQQSTKR
ncbi:antibiotic biosynthesis monooxygenase family protein [Actinotignum schaalii]|uniref:antibiotic biosynthesis monooxygenase family protein n=1 Tax=Actinotignum schaalii TaxID=59505 RepID=UPI0004175525|nr:antibiotic biosynthesis monooxygenase [Actinotignum schaalii]WQN44302.1 antibiotic biosynthesis monooxygenase [Actinotignum schaalii]